MHTDPLVDQIEAAELLGVSPSTMNGWRNTGRGPAYVALSSRCVRYKISDLQRYVASKRQVGAEAKRIDQYTTS